MTYRQIIKTLEAIALTQPNIRTTGYGRLYDQLNAAPSINWDVFYITPAQFQSEGDEGFTRYGLNLFYISRLENVDGDNMLQIQSIGRELLKNIVNTFCELTDSEIYGTTIWQCFNARFGDLAAGLYCTIILEVPDDAICIEYFEDEEEQYNG